jgi:hypothetical protein
MGIGITCPFLARLKLNKKETPDIRHAQGAARWLGYTNRFCCQFRVGFGIGGNISSNLFGAGVGFSENGGAYAYAVGFVMNERGQLDFSPSASYSYTVVYNSVRESQTAESRLASALDGVPSLAVNGSKPSYWDPASRSYILDNAEIFYNKSVPNNRWFATDIMSAVNNGMIIPDAAFKSVNNSTTGRFLSNGYKYISTVEMEATMKLAKPLTRGIAVVNIATIGIAVANDIDNGNYMSATTRAAVFGVATGAAFIPVVGWGVSLSIGIADAIWGDDFYNYVEKNW